MACCGPTLGAHPDRPIVVGNLGGVTVQVVALHNIAGMQARHVYWVTGTDVVRLVSQGILAWA